MIFSFKGIYHENSIYKWSPLFCFQGQEIPLSPCPFFPLLLNLTKCLSIPLVNAFGN